MEDNLLNVSEDTLKNQSLDEIIRQAEFPEDYDAFDDEQLDMIP